MEERKLSPSERFQNAFGFGQRLSSSGMIVMPDQSPRRRWFQHWSGMSVFLPMPDDKRMVVGIIYDPKAWGGQPVIQLQLLALKIRGTGRWDGRPWIMGLPGDPVVLCNLNKAQAKYAFRYGLPKDLLREMVLVAQEADWIPYLHNPGHFGRIIPVDAQPYTTTDAISVNISNDKPAD